MPKTCCCGCTLRQGVIGIMIYDGIVTLLALIGALLITAVRDELDLESSEIDAIVAIYWIFFLLPFLRFMPAIISACTNFKPSTRAVAVICRIISDSITLLLYIIGFAIYFLATNLIGFLIFLGLEIYFCWIWVAFTKEKEEDKPASLAAPAQNVIVIQGGQPAQPYAPQPGGPAQGVPVYSTGQPMQHMQPMQPMQPM